MYVNAAELNFELLYQGDILDKFPFFIFDNPTFLVKEGGHFEASEKAEHDEEALVAVKSKISRIIILSQTCDVKNRENIIIAPVYPIKEYEDAGILTGGKIGLIKKRKISYWFYLPALEGIIPDSIVDLQTMHYLPQTVLRQYTNKKIVSMTDWGKHHLGWALGNYFGRPIESKDE